MESGLKLRTLHTYPFGEFTSVEFDEYCYDRGVNWHLMVPYSLQQNDIVEHCNHMVVAMVRRLLKVKGMPGRFWGKAMTIAVQC